MNRQRYRLVMSIVWLSVFWRWELTTHAQAFLRSEACPCSEAVPADDLWKAIAHCEAALASGVEDCKPDSIYLQILLRHHTGNL